MRKHIFLTDKILCVEGQDLNEKEIQSIIDKYPNRKVIHVIRAKNMVNINDDTPDKNVLGSLFSQKNQQK